MRKLATCLALGSLVLCSAGLARAGLMGYWSFDDGSGTTLADTSGRGNNGALAGTAALPTWAPGHSAAPGDFSLQFTGVTGSSSADPHVLLGNLPDLRIAGDQTIVMWLCPTEMDERRGAYGKAYGGSGTVNMFRDSESGPAGDGTANLIYFYGNTGVNGGPPNPAPGQPGYQSHSAPISKDQWNFVTITRDLETTASDGQLTWYINGSILTRTPIFTSPDGDHPVVPGNLPAYFARAYNSNWVGMIDNASIWNEALDRRKVIALQHDAYTPLDLAGGVYLVDVAGYTYSAAPNAHNPTPPTNPYYRDENKDAGSPTGDLTDDGRFGYVGQSPTPDDGTVGWTAGTPVDITFDLGGSHLLDQIMIGYSYWHASSNGAPDDVLIALSTDGVFDTETFTTYAGFDGTEFRNELFIDIGAELASHVMLRFDGGATGGRAKYLLDEVAFFAVPEPATLTLLALGGLGLLARRRRQRI